jgi:TRAP-type mannitol/chloroaromatic compound transport system permease small subunit
MEGLLGFSRSIDWFNEKIAVIANWLVLLACLVSAGNAALRYLLNYFPGPLRDFLGTYVVTNAALEMQWYMFAGMVMLGAAYTLKMNEHVRVDLLYGNVSEQARNWIDFLGGIVFLLPICLIMIYHTWPWFVESWGTGIFGNQEKSTNAGGLLRWPVKLILPVGFGLVALQGISEIIKASARLQGYVLDGVRYERPLQ